MNFYAEDVEWLQREYGDGWTERIRQHIHSEVTRRRSEQIMIKPKYRTLGDLGDEH